MGSTALPFVQHIVAGTVAAQIKIGQELVGTPLGHDPLGNIGAPAKNTRDFDLRIFFVKLGVKLLILGAAI